MDDNNGVPKSIKKAAQISTKQFAYFIVDGLIMANLIKDTELERAVSVVIDEINIRKAIKDYSFDNEL